MLLSSDHAFLRCAFFGWQTKMVQRARTERVLKDCCVKLSENTSSGNIMLFFNAWKVCSMKAKDCRARRSDFIIKKYAARLFESDSASLLKTSFLEWWRCARDIRANATLEKMQAAKAEERLED